MNQFGLRNWHQALADCQNRGQSYVLITVLTIAGSTPREAGAKMLVTSEAQFDTIGGGHLELKAIEHARELLLKGQHVQQIQSFPLASKLGQCCGGAMKVLFEVMCNHAQTLAVFGAGHVAKALVPILAQLPLSIRWIDSRENMFDDQHQVLSHANVTKVCDEDPVAELSQLPEKSYLIILTHNHQLDYELVERALTIGNFGFVGMIGSFTKAKRFKTRLQHRGFSDSQIASLVSPIGDFNIQGKRPIEVAVSISAQIINLLNQATPSGTYQGAAKVNKQNTITSNGVMNNDIA